MFFPIVYCLVWMYSRLRENDFKTSNICDKSVTPNHLHTRVVVVSG
jgi:hypothetical protein